MLRMEGRENSRKSGVYLRIFRVTGALIASNQRMSVREKLCAWSGLVLALFLSAAGFATYEARKLSKRIA